MLCEVCKQNEATIHIQEIVGNAKKTMHLCANCAAVKQKQGALEFGAFNLAEMHYNLSSHIPGDRNQSSAEATLHPELEDLSCDHCGWNMAMFRKTNRLGCPECYSAFRPFLIASYEKNQKGSQHVGHRPDSTDGTEVELLYQLNLMQHELQERIATEDYEAAAKLRDKIVEMEKQLADHQGGK